MSEIKNSSNSNSDNDDEEEKIDIINNEIKKKIEKPYNISNLLSLFATEFNEDKNAEYDFSYIDEKGKKKLEKDFTNTDIYEAKEIIVKKIEENKENNEVAVLNSKSEEEEEDYLKLVYNGNEKKIKTPYEYKKLLNEFVKAFDVDVNSEYDFTFIDNGVKKILQKNFLTSDINNIKELIIHKKEERKESNEEQTSSSKSSSVLSSNISKKISDEDNNFSCNIEELKKK